jgi:hypothetical protein
MIHRLRLGALVLVFIVPWLGSVAAAEPILPAPSASSVDQTLADLAAGFQRQQDIFATAETGISLDIFIKPEDVDLVRTFFAQGAARDFQQATGRHPFSVVSSFEEYGDEGNFAGVASVGVAARLMVLRRDKAPDDEIVAARNAAIRAAQAWHVYGAIGGPGVIARGIRRVRPLNASDPALPTAIPEVVPLKDGNGNPLPTDKGDAWRAPVVPGFDGWIWMDDTSKDQVVGYALACAWLYDALKGDPLVPDDVLGSLAADMKHFGQALQTVAPETGVDLCLRDADGRLTGFHDLNPRELIPGLVVPESDTARNGFNATLALAIVRASYQVSGDDAIGRWYYDDLVASRDFPTQIAANPGLIFMGEATNFSNVNMLAIAYATLARFETDPGVRAKLQDSIQHAFWDVGSARDVSHVKQAWFDAIYASLSPNADAGAIANRIREQLSGFQPAPAFERDRVNCDDQEIAAGQCLAVDDTTVIHIAAGTNHGGGKVADAVLPMSIRPDTDFEWRSDPFELNGSASNLMDPRGDYLAAYWLARLMDRDVTKNVSPNARPWPDVTDTGKGVAKGCRCDAADLPGLLGFVVVVGFRRRSRRRS